MGNRSGTRVAREALEVMVGVQVELSCYRRDYYAAGRPRTGEVDDRWYQIAVEYKRVSTFVSISSHLFCCLSNRFDFIT